MPRKTSEEVTLVPNTCIKCDAVVQSSSWEIEWRGDNELEVFYHCPNLKCEVEVWRSIFRFDGQEIFTKLEEDEIKLHVPRGNAPTCPKCGNWNALLDKTRQSIQDESIILYFECRDCGYTVRADKCKEVIS
jgi:DNA-directed RNA polymerase subunit M/transcription elongation factor TFIIS